MPGQVHHFHWADYLVFALTLVVSAFIGLYYGLTGKRQSTTAEFLMGGRRLKWVPVALSLHASFLSAIFVLGTPAEVYFHGSMYALLVFGYLPVAPIVAHLFLPVYHKLQITSAYEYLEKRFSRSIRSLGSCTFVIMMVLYMSVVLYAPALAFSQVSGLSMWISILGIGLVCTFYTVMGGMKAVVWTDAFQMIVILGGVITLIICGTLEVGGASRVWQIAYNGSRLSFNDFRPTLFVRYTFWSQFIGGGVMTATLYAANQAMIQRYLTIKNLRHAQASVYMAMGSSVVYLLLVVIMGVVMYAYYHTCDPYTTRQISKGDQLIPLFMMEVLGHLPGLPGLFTAATFCAALSTVSSGVNSLSAIVLEDIVKPVSFCTVSSGVNSLSAVVLEDLVKPVSFWYRETPLKEHTATLVSKCLAVMFGLLTIALGFAASSMGAMVLQIALSLFGVVGGPLLGLMCLGVLFPCCNSWGAGAGLLTSLAFNFWLTMGAMLTGSPPCPLPLDVADCLMENSSSISPNIKQHCPLSYPSVNSTLFHNQTVGDSSRLPMGGLYQISYMWYSPLAVVVAVIVGLTVSAITRFLAPGSGHPVKPELLAPCLATRCQSNGCFPNRKEDTDGEVMDLKNHIDDTEDVKTPLNKTDC